MEIVHKGALASATPYAYSFNARISSSNAIALTDTLSVEGSRHPQTQATICGRRAIQILRLQAAFPLLRPLCKILGRQSHRHLLLRNQKAAATHPPCPQRRIRSLCSQWYFTVSNLLEQRFLASCQTSRMLPSSLTPCSPSGATRSSKLPSPICFIFERCQRNLALCRSFASRVFVNCTSQFLHGCIHARGVSSFCQP